MHVAGGREDALHASRGGGRREVLLDHLGERRPLALLRLPPREDLDVEGRLLRVCEVLLELVEQGCRRRSEAGGIVQAGGVGVGCDYAKCLLH